MAVHPFKRTGYPRSYPRSYEPLQTHHEISYRRLELLWGAVSCHRLSPNLSGPMFRVDCPTSRPHTAPISSDSENPGLRGWAPTRHGWGAAQQAPDGSAGTLGCVGCRELKKCYGGLLLAGHGRSLSAATASKSTGPGRRLLSGQVWQPADGLQRAGGAGGAGGPGARWGLPYMQNVHMIFCSLVSTCNCGQVYLLISTDGSIPISLQQHVPVGPQTSL